MFGIIMACGDFRYDRDDAPAAGIGAAGFPLFSFDGAGF
jgi:hypothetical protein